MSIIKLLYGMFVTDFYLRFVLFISSHHTCVFCLQHTHKVGFKKRKTGRKIFSLAIITVVICDFNIFTMYIWYRNMLMCYHFIPYVNCNTFSIYSRWWFLQTHFHSFERHISLSCVTEIGCAFFLVSFYAIMWGFAWHGIAYTYTFIHPTAVYISIPKNCKAKQRFSQKLNFNLFMKYFKLYSTHTYLPKISGKLYIDTIKDVVPLPYFK